MVITRKERNFLNEFYLNLTIFNSVAVVCTNYNLVIKN